MELPAWTGLLIELRRRYNFTTQFLKVVVAEVRPCWSCVLLSLRHWLPPQSELRTLPQIIQRMGEMQKKKELVVRSFLVGLAVNEHPCFVEGCMNLLAANNKLIQFIPKWWANRYVRCYGLQSSWWHRAVKVWLMTPFCFRSSDFFAQQWSTHSLRSIQLRSIRPKTKWGQLAWRAMRRARFL